MQVILKQDIPQVGRIGEIIKVKDGYARNFLIPRSMAVAANTKNVKLFEHNKRIIELQKKKVQKESEGLVGKLKSVSLKIERRVNESGKLFGSLTSSEIAAELAKINHTFDRRDIELEAVRTAGDYAVKLRLPGDVYATINLTVVGIEDKADKKAAKGKKSAKSKKSEDEVENTADTEEAVATTEASE
jgi:large subunit ribosomal protein L9